MKDINKMLSEAIQHYYSNEYIHYQSTVINDNPLLLEDQKRIIEYIKELKIRGDIIDVGSGNCQWVDHFKEKINYYYAIEFNEIALSQAPKSDKIIPIYKDVFEDGFDLSEIVLTKVDYAILSFFISHFTDATILSLFDKLKFVKNLLIIDTYWSKIYKDKYQTKKLREIRRRTADQVYIQLPKRAFNHSDLKRLGNAKGYEVNDIVVGNYWFICKLSKVSSTF